MNTPNPKTIADRQRAALIAQARAKGIRVTEKKEKGK